MGLPLVRDADGVRTITFDRPDTLNALTLDDLACITAAVRDVVTGTRAIVLTGTGERAFSSGMHIDTFASATPESARAIIEQVGACVAAIRLTPLPTVAMINGYCLGAAFEMALACDVRTAYAGVHVGLPEVKLGIPSVVEASMLIHHIGLSKAKELTLTGDIYAVADLPPGLINRTAPPARLRAVTDELVRALTAPTAEVIAAQKSLFETWLNTGLDHGIEVSKDVFGEIFRHQATTDAIARYRDRGR